MVLIKWWRKPPPPICRAVRIARNYRGISQQKLSKMMGISQSYISKVERGELTPTNEYLEKLSTSVNIPILGIMDICRGCESGNDFHIKFSLMRSIESSKNDKINRLHVY